MKERLSIILSHFSLTHTELAALVGMNNSQVSSWMSGRSKMPQATAMAFQAALGVRWQWLLYGEGEMLMPRAEFLEDSLKALADLWPRLSESDRKYVLGLAEGIHAGSKK